VSLVRRICICSDHWRKNLPILGLKCRTFAVDLLGYGYSDKPSPRYLSLFLQMHMHTINIQDCIFKGQPLA